LRIGLYTLWHEWRGEKKYKLNTTGASQLSKFKLTGNNLEHATEYMPVNYELLEDLLWHLPSAALKGTFLDIGCGKGRALCVAAHYGFSTVSGIDFAKELLQQAKENLIKTKVEIPALTYELLWQDFSECTIKREVTCIFLFNPFHEVLMQKVLQKVEASLKKDPRTIYIIYASPKFSQLFSVAGYEIIVRLKKANFIEGIILRLN
jgi:SAM-dependent methyltransferase